MVALLKLYCSFFYCWIVCVGSKNTGNRNEIRANEHEPKSAPFSRGVYGCLYDLQILVRAGHRLPGHISAGEQRGVQENWQESQAHTMRGGIHTERSKRTSMVRLE